MTRFSQSNQAFSIRLWLYLLIGTALALGNWLVVPCAQAQDVAAEAPRFITTSFQTNRDAPPPGLYLEGITLSPYSRARAGQPFTLYSIVRNTSTTARAVVAVAKVDGALNFKRPLMSKCRPASNAVLNCDCACQPRCAKPALVSLFR